MLGQDGAPWLVQLLCEMALANHRAGCRELTGRYRSVALVHTAGNWLRHLRPEAEVLILHLHQFRNATDARQAWVAAQLWQRGSSWPHSFGFELTCHRAVGNPHGPCLQVGLHLQDTPYALHPNGYDKLCAALWSIRLYSSQLRRMQLPSGSWSDREAVEQLSSQSSDGSEGSDGSDGSYGSYVKMESHLRQKCWCVKADSGLLTWHCKSSRRRSNGAFTMECATVGDG